jgi:hypothetical protein
MTRAGPEQFMQALVGGSRPGRTTKPDLRVIEAVVWDVGPGGMRFKLSMADPHVWGPAPWPRTLVEPAAEHDHEGSTPGRGARCLVVFAPTASGTASGNPWVVAWWPA